MDQINNTYQNNISDVQQNQNITAPKSGMALASLILGFVSFIPLLGIFTGVLAIILGIIAKGNIRKGLETGKKKAAVGVILGILGILFSIVIYGSLFYFGFVAKSGPFNDMKKQLSQQVLTQNAGTIELYKNKYGNYPTSLDDLSKAGYTVWPGDHYMKPFYYKVSYDGSTYDLRSLGPDGEYGTLDDIFPQK